MTKKQWMIPLSTVMMIGLVGCANDNRDGVKNSNNLARPMGYYSNENHPNTHNNFLRDNDGAFTEMMDHTLGEEDQITKKQKRKMLQTRDENGNPENPTKPLASKDRNFFQKDNRFSTSDVNYHGHLNKIIGYNGIATDPSFQENATSKIKNVVARVNNVQDVRSVAYGNTVMVSVHLNNNRKAAQTKQAIVDAVQPYVNGRTVKVIIDEGTLGRDQNIDNDVPQMTPNEDVPHKKPH